MFIIYTDIFLLDKFEITSSTLANGDKKRIGAACFYIGMIIVVISCGLADVAPGIVILLLIIQLCAAIWYAASYFPYGRTILKNCATKPCT